MNRRQFLAASTAVAVAPALTAKPKPALIAITLDLEMSRHYPKRGITKWDYEKGNLDEATKTYTMAACERVKRRGGVVHSFCVGRVLEQPSTDWLKDIAAAGHPIGNHTYDHVNVLAKKPDDIQYRFRAAPWLIRGRTPAQVIRKNIAMTTLAMKERAGITPNGFRTPGGFRGGLKGRPDIQKMLLDLGFKWCSSHYPPHPMARETKPSAKVLEGIASTQAQAQPWVYPSGLIEVPMSPVSDVTGFRSGRWKLDWYLDAIRLSIEWCIEQGAAYDYLAHPSCLGVVDPKFRVIDLICDLAEKAGDRAQLVDLNAFGERAVPQ